MKNTLQAMLWQKLTLFTLFLLSCFGSLICTGDRGLLFSGIVFKNDKMENGRMVILSGCGLLQSTIEQFTRSLRINMKNHCRDTWLPGQGLNLRPLKCEAGMLMVQL
jgi:hypothetical protein